MKASPIYSAFIQEYMGEAFFAKWRYMGMPKEDIMFFEQGTLPAFTPEGKFIMETGSRVAVAPDGNGGIYPSLKASGCLDRLQERNVKYLHIFGIDNVLLRPADPQFIGYCIAQKADCGNKSVWKRSADEKVGVLAKRGGRPAVVEYSEISEAQASQVDAEGRLVFGAGNICNHFMTVEFLVDEVIPNLTALLHVAEKKVPYANANGRTVKPTANNGIKLEAFVFDVFPMSKRMGVLECLREEEFAPVKNAEGPDSPEDTAETAKQMINTLCRGWLTRVGGFIDGPADAVVEISPLVSYAGEGLEEGREGGRFRDMRVSAPVYIQ
eukprot:NODE_1559_length_1112_cov_314.047304.p1 GENE.NODE_1559_length_1112_cov_314.047304~~NODE_1559_length_1112_cov_314.047304.p1  ORF type:complete len:325 (+),score=101.65 NODE_1559_length_1112_cov_314.047304:25-999(+)